MAIYDINNLSSQITSRNGYSLTPSFGGATDVFEFDISNDRTIGLHLHNISSGDDADLRLFRDSNGNGRLDAGDQQVASSRRGGNQNDAIRFDASAGTYFAQVERYAAGSVGNVSYDLDLSATYDLDALSGSVVSRDGYSLSSSDPNDVFALTLDYGRRINLHLHDISAGDDADLRLFEDSNNNGIFDGDDLQVASSVNGSNLNDVINYDAAAGTYFAQVSRYSSGSSGNVSYDLDLSATSNSLALSGSVISRDDYGVSESEPADTFAITLDNSRSINLHLHDISAGDDADLRLFADSNNNGIFDSDDLQVASSLNGGNRNDVIDYQASAGTYFAQVSRYAAGSVGGAIYDLDLSGTYDAGQLGGNGINRTGYQLTASDATDVFEFDVDLSGQIALNLNNISSGDDADLRLYEDTNSNGIFDSDDLQVASSLNSGNRDDVINYNAATGTYFAQVSRYAAGSAGNVSYDLDISAASTTDALSGSVIRRNNYGLSASEPTDVFALTLDNSRSINLHLHNISAGDDADLRLYADSNNNGIFDSGDFQVASSVNGSNRDDSIDYSASAGTYFAQVSRYGFGSVGDVSYDLDLSSTYDVGQLDSQGISRNGYQLTAADPRDVFEFDLDQSGQVTLNLNNISAGDDADLRLYEDTNGNGLFDGDDQQVDSSRRSSNADDVITYAANAGTYFAQVERYAPGSSGNVSYDLDLSVDSSGSSGSSGPSGNVPETYQAFDATQVFSLNSNTNANHIIYLDFDGHTTTNTSWNSSTASSIETPAYDTDGDVTQFSAAEQETIWRIWQRVAEDFSPFNVNVTTEAPSIDRLARSGGNDSQWGIRAVIGGDGSWYRAVDGVALRNSFTSDADVPTFIFEDNLALGDGDEVSTAETISHEVGHTLGLEHDGNNSVEYYQGHGTGAASWAPIMGYSDFSAVTQWSQGEYRNASNTQDDLAIITGNNGFDYRTDDYGDSLVTADALTVGGNQAQTYGIIETNTDVDWFSFSSVTGNIDLAINAFERGANLDILARLYNSAGQLLQQSNPLGSLSASFDVDLAGGDYFLSVTGTGTGNPNTGYSDYGSLGQYSIVGTVA